MHGFDTIVFSYICMSLLSSDKATMERSTCVYRASSPKSEPIFCPSGSETPRCLLLAAAVESLLPPSCLPPTCNAVLSAYGCIHAGKRPECYAAYHTILTQASKICLSACLPLFGLSVLSRCLWILDIRTFYLRLHPVTPFRFSHSFDFHSSTSPSRRLTCNE